MEDKAGAGYHIEFQKCNHESIRETIPFMQDIRAYQINSLQELQQVKKYTYHDILNELSLISQDIYYYHAYDDSLKLHYIKIMSPDFFAHMSLSNKLNIENNYAKQLHITAENAFMGKIPFP